MNSFVKQEIRLQGNDRAGDFCVSVLLTVDSGCACHLWGLSSSDLTSVERCGKLGKHLEEIH